MIVKEDGRQVTGDVLHLEMVEVYRHYQLLNLKLKHLLWKRRYGLFGFQGFGTMIGVAAVCLLIVYIAEPGSTLQQVAGMMNLTAIVLALWGAYKLARWEYEHAVDKWGGLLDERSESGVRLNYLTLDLDESAEYSIAEVKQFEQTYSNPILNGTLHFVEQPLATPVVIDGKAIVGAFVEIDVENTTGQITSTYHMMSETGHAVEVEYWVFEQMLRDIWTTPDGDAYTIPVLTGKHDSLLWGAVGDMMTTTSQVMPMIKSRSSRQISVLRKAITHIERVLLRTRRSTTNA